MNNPAKTYAYHALRVAQLLAWLEVALQRHELQADASAYPWGYVASIEKAEHDLKHLVAFIAAVSMEELERALEAGEGKRGGSHE